MSLLTVFFTGLFYVAFLVFVFGTVWRCFRPRSPRVTVAKTNKQISSTYNAGLVKMITEAVFFRSLFRASRWEWLVNWVFHVALLVILLRHAHYFFAAPSVWMFHIQTVSSPAAYILTASLLCLWLRRLVIARLRSQSTIYDHLLLLLILLVTTSGIALKQIAPHNMLAAKNFIRGLMYFDWFPFPVDLLMCVHFGLVALLLLVYPFSKLIHAPGISVNLASTRRNHPRSG